MGRAGLLEDSVQSDRSASPIGNAGAAEGNGLRVGGGGNGSDTAGDAGLFLWPYSITLALGPYGAI